MHKTGKEHTALSTFCDYMNTPESKKKTLSKIFKKNFIVFIERQLHLVRAQKN